MVSLLLSYPLTIPTAREAARTPASSAREGVGIIPAAARGAPQPELDPGEEEAEGGGEEGAGGDQSKVGAGPARETGPAEGKRECR